VKKFDENFNIILEQEAQSDHKENNPEVKAESSKTKIPETEKKDLTEKKETPKALSAKKASPPVPPKPDRLKVKVMPAEPAETAKDDRKDEDVQEGYGEYLERIEEIDPKSKEGIQAYWDWFE
jgi:hypothetical protein